MSEEARRAYEDAQARASADGDAGSRRFTTRGIDLEAMRPTRFLWHPWLVYARLNLEVGKEKIGKSSLQAYLAAAVTRGELPGARHGRPGSVLWVGADEDDWNEVVTPRLYALGADLERLREFVPVNDADVFNVVDHAAELEAELRARDYELVVIEQLLDVLPPLRSPYDPSAIRAALRPLRRVLAARSVTALATLHVNKARVTELRRHVQGSVQYGAVARSTILVATHPHDDDRRVVVLGPANYVASVPALSFRIEEHRFDYDGRRFEIGRVTELEEEAGVGLSDVLVGEDAEPKPRPRDRHRETLLELVRRDPPIGVGRLAELLEASRTSIRRLVGDLVAEGLLEHDERGVHPATSLREADGWTPSQSAIFDDLEADEK